MFKEKEVPTKDLASVWRQRLIPVFFIEKALFIRLPYRPANRQWLEGKAGTRDPIWLSDWKCWKLPRSRFNELVKLVLLDYGKAYIIQPYKEVPYGYPFFQTHLYFYIAYSL